MNYLDLFSGIGGFALGAYWAGCRFDRHYFSEIDPWCCRLYQQRFPDAIPVGDIKSIDGRRLISYAEREQEIEQERAEQKRAITPISLCERRGWIISGGFPCQDISTAGKGAGITGARSGLWFEYARLIGEIRPRYAIMENVGALTRRGLDRVLGSLAEIGYDAEWSDIRASDVGAPHRRERIWIVAYPAEQRLERPIRKIIQGQRTRSSASRYDVADTHNQGPQGWDERGERSGELPPWSSGEAYTGDWQSGAGIRRVANGVLQRVDRLKGLGNSIVPQIAEIIFRQLKEKI